MTYPHIAGLMENGYSIGIRFISDETASSNDHLYCELIQHARYGEHVSFSVQGCPVGSYVLGHNVLKPDEYYFNSGRYKTIASARRSAASLPRLEQKYSSIRLFPVNQHSPDPDVVMLFVSPSRAMRLIQALTYHKGFSISFITGGTASVCGDCTARPANTHKLCISLGCKGSRKHSRYGEDEVIVGIPYRLVRTIENGLDAIPGMYE